MANELFARGGWEETCVGIISKIRLNHFGDDIAVYVGKQPAGFFIWCESEQVHVHLTPAYVMWALGERLSIKRVQL